MLGGKQSGAHLLGLRIAAPRWTALWAAALLLYYLLSMSRSLSLYDSPELALVAAQFGLGHPFGQPLHSMLGGLVARIPGLDSLLALNALSALAGALSLIPVSSLSEALSRTADGRALRWIAPSLASLGMFVTLWEPATRIEVYSLATFFGLWAIARAVQAWREREQRLLPYLAIGLSLGLSASSNPVCALTAATAVAGVLVLTMPGVGARGIGMTALGGALGLLAYLYVFAVAGREDVLVWGAPRDMASAAHYFSGADFTAKQVSGLADWGSHLVSLVSWSVEAGLALVFLLALLGFASFTKPPALGLCICVTTLLLVLGFVAHNGVFAPDVLDYLGYLALPTWLAASGIATLVAGLASLRKDYGALALLALASFCMLCPPSALARTRHLDTVSWDLASEALERAPRGAILLVEHDHWVGPLLYLQEVEKRRPDVLVLAYGLASSSWYWSHLSGRHPELAAFELRGPGGRSARVRRFLHANPARPVQVEHLGLASRLALPACPSSWLLDVSDTCDPNVDTLELSAWLADQSETLGEGSPGTDGMLAQLALQRGHELWLLGQPRKAIASLLAASPQTLSQLDQLELARVPARQPPRAATPAPRFEPEVALGHRAHNLHYAASMARQSGAAELASTLQALSDELGPVRQAAP